MNRAIDKVQHCQSMLEVRRAINALDDVLVPLLVERVGYMTQAARIKQLATQVRDEARIEDIVQRVRACAGTEGGNADTIEQIYRSMMETCIAFEEREFARLREVASQGEGA
ncbi:MAG: chorismate mutase [Giesbergeria sp.]